MMGQWSVTDLTVGERVLHVKEPDLRGEVVEVEENGLSVMVLWDGCAFADFQWANKVVRESP